MDKRKEIIDSVWNLVRQAGYEGRVSEANVQVIIDYVCSDTIPPLSQILALLGHDPDTDISEIYKAWSLDVNNSTEDTASSNNVHTNPTCEIQRDDINIKHLNGVPLALECTVSGGSENGDTIFPDIKIKQEVSESVPQACCDDEMESATGGSCGCVTEVKNEPDSEGWWKMELEGQSHGDNVNSDHNLQPKGNGHLGDVDWLKYSSLSTHLDNEETSNDTTMSVNPLAVLPIELTESCNQDSLSLINANSTTSGLPSYCSNIISNSGKQLQSTTNSVPNVLSQEHSSVRILSVTGGNTSDDTTMICENPLAVLPKQIIEFSNPDNLVSSKNEISSTLTLSVDHGNLISSDSSKQNLQSISDNMHVVQSREHSSVGMLSFADVSSPSKSSNFLTTMTKDSPLKCQKFEISANALRVSGETVATGLENHVSNSNMGGGNVEMPYPSMLHDISTDKGTTLLKLEQPDLPSPSQANPVLLEHLLTRLNPQVYQTDEVVSTKAVTSAMSTASPTTTHKEKQYPKPIFPYCCLIALALKNSEKGHLPVHQIYSFICENFPFYKTAPANWKNSVRNNLSKNKYFTKLTGVPIKVKVRPTGVRETWLWALKPATISQIEKRIDTLANRDPAGLLRSMAYPKNLEAIKDGQAGLDNWKMDSPEPVTLIYNRWYTSF